MFNYTKVVKKLLEEMFKRVGLEYTEDYCKKQEWYLIKSWTIDEQDSFKIWGEKLLRKELKMSSRTAKREMSWFILNVGWTTRLEDEDKN